jgi:hypothetical protein
VKRKRVTAKRVRESLALLGIELLMDGKNFEAAKVKIVHDSLMADPRTLVRFARILDQVINK